MSRYLKKLSILIFVVFSPSVLANTINGTITLPAGVVAPAGGVTFSVKGFRFGVIDTNNDTDNVTIPAGDASAAYTLNFSDDVDRRLRFDCANTCGALDITTTGFWNNSDGIVTLFQGESFLGSTNHIVNIQLESADTFSGTVMLPSGLSAQGGASLNETISVNISSSSAFTFGSFSQSVLLEPGDQGFDFRIGVPTSATSAGWEVIFSCFLCNDRIESGPHYATAVNGGTPSTVADNAFVFERGSEYSDINLVLIDIMPPAPEPNSSSVIAPILLLLDDDS